MPQKDINYLGFITALLTFLLIPLWRKNNAYYKIIKEFKENLPRPQNEAKQVNSSDLSGSLKHMSVLNVSTHKTSITEKDLDFFYRRLNNFDYSFVFFRNYYKDYTRNLNRFNPQANNKNFDLVFLQKILDNETVPLSFFKVFMYHFKYKWKITSMFYRVK
jgi:hypothetical protein